MESRRSDERDEGASSSRASPVRISEYDQIHALIKDDPETVWDRLRRYLCVPSSADVPDGAEQRDILNKVDLLEDLMFWHSDAFIDRIEAVSNECPEARDAIARAHVDGRAADQGLERFWALQSRLESDP